MVVSHNDQQTPVSLLDRIRLAKGERDWEVFLDVYDGLIHTWLLRAGVSPLEIDDVKQEILMALVRAVPTFQHNGHVGAFRKWLRILVSQRVLNYFRQSQHRRQLSNLHSGHDDALAFEDRMLTDRWEREHDEHVLQQLLKVVEIHFTATTWEAFRCQVRFASGRARADRLRQGLSA